MYKEPGAYTNIDKKDLEEEVRYVVAIDNTAPTTSKNKVWSINKINAEFANQNEVQKVSSDLENVKTYTKGISILELATTLKKDIKNPIQCSEIIQHAVDNYECVYFPNGEYRLANTINLKAQYTNGLELYGESFSETKIILDSAVTDTHLFNILGVKKWGNRYKYFKNLCFITEKAKFQSIFRYEEINSQDILDCGLQIENCNIFTTGYVLDFRDCPWVGNMYIKNCEIAGNGIAKIKPKKRLSDAYWHSTSNLTIEDVHFSGKEKRRGAVLELTGCQNTQINRVTIEGVIYSLQDEADNIGDGFVGAANYTKGLFFDLTDSSVVFDTCWFETGGENNTPKALSGYIGGDSGVRSNPNIQIIFNNNIGYYQFDKKIKIGSGIDNGTLQNVTFSNYFYYEGITPFKMDKGGVLTINNLSLISSQAYEKFENETRIKINNIYILTETGLGTIGPGGITNPKKTQVLYEYNGGYQNDKKNVIITIDGKFANNMCHYPHWNSKYGNTLLIKADTYAFRFATGNMWIEENKIVNTEIKYRMIHCNEKNKMNEGKIITKRYSKEYNNQFLWVENSDVYNFGVIIPEKDSCEFIELLSLYYSIGEYSSDIKFNNTVSSQSKDVYGSIYGNQINLEGTWKKGDIVYMADGINKTIFTSYGTTRPISIAEGITVIDANTLKITNIADFKQVVDGDYIKLVSGDSEINNTIDHIEYTNTEYLIKLTTPLAENIKTINSLTNQEPTKILVKI